MPSEPKPLQRPDMTKANTPIHGTIDLRRLPAKGVRVLHGYSGTPDRFGILRRDELVVPPFRRGCWFATDGPRRWPAGANRILPWPFGERFGRLNYGALFLLLELERGGTLAIVPIAGPLTTTWLNVSGGERLVLNLGTLGTEPVACDAPLFAWARSHDLYTACREAWAQAIRCKPVAGSTALREDKRYPDVFRYLGWCSWEEYKGTISSDLLVKAVGQLEATGLPVRYVLVDDGHLEHEGRRLKSFAPNAKFPDGWRPLLELRSEAGIRWMGVWHDFNGYWGTVAPDNQLGAAVNEQLAELPTGAILPRNDPAAARAFYDAFLGSVRDQGFDFVKIDDQATNLAWYMGSDNAVEAARRCSVAVDAVVERLFDGLINCMAQNSVCVLNTRHGAVTRCSIDYKVDPVKGKSHVWQSYHNTLWLCHTVWGDHDMFHSSDPDAGRMMAVSKAMSGGPVYLSDAPTDIVADHVRPLCYADGELLRPLAPAGPLPDCACVDPMRQPVAYRAVAPLPGGAAAIHACHLRHPSPKRPLRAAVTPDDYAHASAMLQPCPGTWRVPAEGLVVYDWYAGAARKLGTRYTFELDGFADRLLHLCPIRKGWAVVGRTDKYLSPAAVEVLDVSAKALKLRLAESGPLAIWSGKGAPRARGVDFADAGNGLYTADLPVGQRRRILTLRR